MFSFLKKKLAESIDKLRAAVKPKEEAPAETIQEVAATAQAAIDAKQEIEYKKKLIEKAGYKLKPEIEHVIAKPYEPQLKAAEEIMPELKPEIAAPEPLVEKESILTKVRKAIVEKKITESDIKDVLWDLQIALIESDVALAAAEKITGDIKNALVGKTVKRGTDVEKMIREAMRKSVTEIMTVDSLDLLERIKTKKPFLIVFLGFNGSGKTTTIARVGHMFKQKGISCVFAAADTWRAAAIEQIEEHGQKLGIPVIKQKYGADPAAVIFDAVKHATAKGIQVVLADTAGRSHANLNLMDEMKKIIRVNKPDLKILVLDALTGNDIYEQCKLFNDAVGVDGLIITKADVYEKGGAALSAAWTIKKPLLFLGVGQEYDDLQQFDAEKIVASLLG
ncbi:MAG: signal recognition particle-docking protein FtsY [Candidatus Aenigmatarchaeota archaeon]